MYTAHDNDFGLAREARAFERRLALLGASFIGYSPVPLQRDRAALQTHVVTPAPGARRLVARALRSAWNRIRRAHRRRAAIAELRALNDRTLRDIGVSRADIPAVVEAMLRDGRREIPRDQQPLNVVAVSVRDAAREAGNDAQFDAAA